MKKLILRLFSKKELLDYLISLEKFEEVEMGDHIVSKIFFYVPEMRQWLKKRQNILLRSILTGTKSADVIQGQILENMYLQRFDVPNQPETPKVEHTSKQLPSREEFLEKWNQSNDKQKQDKKDTACGGS